MLMHIITTPMSVSSSAHCSFNLLLMRMQLGIFLELIDHSLHMAHGSNMDTTTLNPPLVTPHGEMAMDMSMHDHAHHHHAGGTGTGMEHMMSMAVSRPD